MTATTATVEVLTAEVRVLMVGSRQVTLSVAKQLDFAPVSHIEPFGRVALPASRYDKDSAVVIGRRRSDGALVRAVNARPPRMPLFMEDDLDPDIPGKLITCASWGWGETYQVVRFHDIQIQIHKGAVQGCEVEGHTRYSGSEQCANWHTNGHDADVRAVVDLWRAEQTLYRAMLALPLIVLAGLR